MTRIALSLLLALFATQASALVLVDANKRILGEVTDAETGDATGYIWIARQHGDATFLLTCNRQECITDTPLEYSNADCTGEVGIRVFDDEHKSHALWRAAIAPPGQTLYMNRKSPKFPPQHRTMLSFWDSHAGCIELDTPQATFYSPVVTVGPLTYTPPLRIQTPRNTAQ